MSGTTVDRNTKIYISGPMTGLKDFNRPAFFEAEKKLKRLGFDIFNPATIRGSVWWEWENYMRECLRELPDCTHIYMLDGWEDSQGANVEYFLAKQIGIKVMNE